MEKEINEQPEVIGYTFASYCSPTTGKITLPKFKFCPSELLKLTIVAAELVFMLVWWPNIGFSNLARIPTEVDIASSFDIGSVPLKTGPHFYFSIGRKLIDTLMAQRYAKKWQNIISLVNVPVNDSGGGTDTVLKHWPGRNIRRFD